MADRTSKTLLIIIAVALCGLLLKPMFAPLPAQAQANGNNSMVRAMAFAPDGTLYIAIGNNLVEYRTTGGRLQQIGSQTLFASSSQPVPGTTYQVVPGTVPPATRTPGIQSHETNTPDGVVVVPLNNRDAEPPVVVPLPQQ